MRKCSKFMFFRPLVGAHLVAWPRGGKGQQSCENLWPSSCSAPMARTGAQGPGAIFAVFACGRLVCLPACRPFWQFCCGTQFLIFMALSFCLGPMVKKKIPRAARAKGEKRKEKEGGLIKVRYGPLGPSTLINKGSSTQCNMGMFVSEKKNRPADAGSFLFLKR